MRNKVILGSDSKMMSFLSRIFDLIILNILFVLCSRVCKIICVNHHRLFDTSIFV